MASLFMNKEMSTFDAGRRYQESITRISNILSNLSGIKRTHELYSKYLSECVGKYELAFEIAKKFGGRAEIEELVEVLENLRKAGASIEKKIEELSGLVA